jgi:hypothetical protein
MHDAEQRPRTARARSASTTLRLRISNRNTSAFRISHNSNKTRLILISNRNITSRVAINFSRAISNRQFARLETTPNPLKTKARRDF